MSEKKTTPHFSELMDELELMSKSLDGTDDLDNKDKDDSDDDKIDAAAAAGDADADADGDGASDVGGADDDEGLTKSMTVTLEDGSMIEAVDGTQLVKALMGKLDSSEETVSKSMGLMLGNMKKIAASMNSQAEKISEQDKLIKSLSEAVETLSGKPAGRKAVLSVHDKPAPSEFKKAMGEDGMSGPDFMAKAMQLQKEGRLMGVDISKIEGCLNNNFPIPEDIIKKVIG